MILLKKTLKTEKEFGLFYPQRKHKKEHKESFRESVLSFCQLAYTSVTWEEGASIKDHLHQNVL